MIRILQWISRSVCRCLARAGLPLPSQRLVVPSPTGLPPSLTGLLPNPTRLRFARVLRWKGGRSHLSGVKGFETGYGWWGGQISNPSTSPTKAGQGFETGCGWWGGQIPPKNAHPAVEPPSLGVAMLCLACLVVLSWVFLACTPPQEKIVLGGIFPNQAFSGRETALVIRGRNFFSGIEIFLRNAKAERLPLSSVDVRTPTEISATLPASAPVGAYDLLLKLPDSTEIVLGAAFEVLPNALTIYILDAGQGDATLIRMPTGETLLIDAGRDEDISTLREQIERLGLTSIDYFLATHYDADHVGGVEKLFAGRDGILKTADDLAPTKAIWDVGGPSKNRGYAAAREAYKDRHLPLDGSSLDSFPTLRFGDVGLSILTTNGVLKHADGTLTPFSCGDDENCRSIGTLITLGGFRFWTAGDLTGGGNRTPDLETALAPVLGAVDIYRAHHHGSKTSSNQALVSALRPRVAIFSAGTQNSYCHPHTEVLERFLKIPDLWAFVTTSGIEQAGSCGSTTQADLTPLGARALLKTGLIRILAEADRYTISLGIQAGAETFSFTPRRP